VTYMYESYLLLQPQQKDRCPPSSVVYHILVGMVASQQCNKGGVVNQLCGSEHKKRMLTFIQQVIHEIFTCEYLPLYGTRKLCSYIA